MSRGGLNCSTNNTTKMPCYPQRSTRCYSNNIIIRTMIVIAVVVFQVFIIMTYHGSEAATATSSITSSNSSTIKTHAVWDEDSTTSGVTGFDDHHKTRTTSTTTLSSRLSLSSSDVTTSSSSTTFPWQDEHTLQEQSPAYTGTSHIVQRQIQPGGNTIPEIDMDSLRESTIISTGMDIGDNALYSHGNVFDIETKDKSDIVITSLTLTTRNPLVGGNTAAVVIYTKVGSYKDDDRVDGTNWDLLATLPLNLLNPPISKGDDNKWLSYTCDVDTECLRPLLIKKQSTQTILILMASLDVVYTEHPDYDVSQPWIEDDHMSVYMGSGIGVFPVIFSQKDVYDSFFDNRLWHGDITYSLMDEATLSPTVVPTTAPTVSPTSYPTAIEVSNPHTIRTLATPLVSSGTITGGQGIMFDISAGTVRNVILRGIKISISTTLTEEQMKTLFQIYYATQSHVGIENNIESWNEMGVEYVTKEETQSDDGSGSILLLELKVNPIVVNTGDVYALYVTTNVQDESLTTNAILYDTSGTVQVGEILAEDNDVQLKVGTAVENPYDDAGSTTTSVASLNGVLIYSTPTDEPTTSPTSSPTSMGGILETQTKLTIGGLGEARVRQLRRKLAMMDNDETRKYFENIGKQFLSRNVNGKGGPEINVSHYVVSADITDDDVGRRRGLKRHIPSFVRRFLQMEEEGDESGGGGGLNVYQTILGEYSPPPVVDFSSIVEDSFSDSGDDFITDLKDSSDEMGAAFAEARSVKAETVSFPKPPEIVQALAELNAPPEPEPSAPPEPEGPPEWLRYVWIACGLIAFVVIVTVSSLVMRHKKKKEKERLRKQQEEEEERINLAAASQDFMYQGTTTGSIYPNCDGPYHPNGLTKQSTLGTLMSDDNTKSLFDNGRRSSWYNDHGGPTNGTTTVPLHDPYHENDPYNNYKNELLLNAESEMMMNDDHYRSPPPPPPSQGAYSNAVVPSSQDGYAAYKAELMEMQDSPQYNGGTDPISYHHQGGGIGTAAAVINDEYENDANLMYYDNNGTTAVEAVRAFTVSPVSLGGGGDGVVGGGGSRVSNEVTSPRHVTPMSTSYRSNRSSGDRRLRGGGGSRSGGGDGSIISSSSTPQGEQRYYHHKYSSRSGSGSVSFGESGGGGVSVASSSVATPNMLYNGARLRQFHYGFEDGDDTSLSLNMATNDHVYHGELDNSSNRLYNTAPSRGGSIGRVSFEGQESTSTSGGGGTGVLGTTMSEEHTVKAILSDASLTQTGKLQLIQQIPNLSAARQEILQDAVLTKTQKLKRLQEQVPRTGSNSEPSQGAVVVEEEKVQSETNEVADNGKNDVKQVQDNDGKDNVQGTFEAKEPSLSTKSVDPLERHRMIQDILRHPTMTEKEKREKIKGIIDGSNTVVQSSLTSNDNGSSSNKDEGNYDDDFNESENHHLPFLSSIQEGDNESRVTTGTCTSSTGKSGSSS